MTDLLIRDWKPLLLCLLLAVLVWFLLGEHGGRPVGAHLFAPTPVLDPAPGLP